MKGFMILEYYAFVLNIVFQLHYRHAFKKKGYHNSIFLEQVAVLDIWESESLLNATSVSCMVMENLFKRSGRCSESKVGISMMVAQMHECRKTSANAK